MKFMALGGTNRVGSSCYYLELGGCRFLLDCGQSVQKRITYSPNYSSLFIKECLYSLSELDAILLSHGHFDHIGALPYFTKACPDTPIYGTTLTKELGNWLLWDQYPRSQNGFERFQKNLRTEEAIQRIRTVSYRRPIVIHGVRITFYEAGHVPGAAMIYMESSEGNVLYTGDFLKHETMLTKGYYLPQNLHPDVVILCGTHAKHPYYLPKNNLSDLPKKIQKELIMGCSAHLSVQQLTKGVEVVCFLKQKIPDIPLYLSEPIWSLAEQLENVGIPIIGESCYRMSNKTVKDGVYIDHQGQQINVNFSLHATFGECVELLNRLRPSTVFVVHAPDDHYGQDNYALQKKFPNKSILYPTQGELYA